MTLCVATRLFVEIPSAAIGALADADAGALHSLDALESLVAYFLFLVVCNPVFTALTDVVVDVVAASVGGRNLIFTALTAVVVVVVAASDGCRNMEASIVLTSDGITTILFDAKQ